jgi:ABC-type sugar transport system ATPase subunit
LDLELRVETRAELRALHDRIGATTVHVTHDQTEALVLGDRIAVLHAGRIEQVAAPDDIWRRPATTFVARFVGSPAMNLVPAGGPPRPSGPAPFAVDAGRHLLGFRPEAVTLRGDPAGADGVVERVDVVGDDAYAYLSVAGTAVVARVRAPDRPAVGDTTAVAVAWRDVHVFDAVTGARVDPP